MTDRPFPPIIGRIAIGQGPILRWFKAYTEWLKELKAHQENRAFQKDMLKQLDQIVESDNTEKWVSKVLDDKKTSGGQQNE